MKTANAITRRRGALLLAGASLALVVGCRHPVDKKLQGRWLGEGIENVSDRNMAAATGWAKGTSMEFAGSTLTVSIPAEEPRSGRYKVARVHESDVFVAVDDGQGQSDRIHFKLDDEHSMRWMLDDRRAIVLRREN